MDLRKQLKDKKTLAETVDQTAKPEKDDPRSHIREDVVYKLDPKTIKPNPDQPRKVFNEDDLKDLAQSIAEKGVLQPIIVRMDEYGETYLIAGERRTRAAILVNLDKIPAIYKQSGNADEMALIENVQREDLNPIDLAESVANLKKKHGYNNLDLVRVMGKAESTISEILSINSLAEEIRIDQRETKAPLPRRTLVKIATIKNHDEMMALYQRAKSGELTSTTVRKLTKNKKPRLDMSPHVVRADKFIIFLKGLDPKKLSTHEREVLKNKLNLIRTLSQDLSETL